MVKWVQPGIEINTFVNELPLKRYLKTKCKYRSELPSFLFNMQTSSNYTCYLLKPTCIFLIQSIFFFFWVGICQFNNNLLSDYTGVSKSSPWGLMSCLLLMPPKPNTFQWYKWITLLYIQALQSLSMTIVISLKKILNGGTTKAFKDFKDPIKDFSQAPVE